MHSCHPCSSIINTGVGMNGLPLNQKTKLVTPFFKYKYKKSQQFRPHTTTRVVSRLTHIHPINRDSVLPENPTED